MIHLDQYLQDGADYQARAVLIDLQGQLSTGRNSNNYQDAYESHVKVARWDNQQEQGYVLTLVNNNNQQLNIAFYTHQSIEYITAIKWKQNLKDTPNPNNSELPKNINKHYNTSYHVKYREYQKISDWINMQLLNHWNN